VGECEELGIWEKAVRMTTDAEQWPRWKVHVTLNPQNADSLAYKYVKLSANDSIIQWEWESGDNRHICTKNSKDSKGSELNVFDGSFGAKTSSMHHHQWCPRKAPQECLGAEGMAVNKHAEALTPISESLPPRRAHIFSPRVPGSFMTAAGVALQVALSFSLPRFLSLSRLSARPPARSRYIARSQDLRPF